MFVFETQLLSVSLMLIYYPFNMCTVYDTVYANILYIFTYVYPNTVINYHIG